MLINSQCPIMIRKMQISGFRFHQYGRPIQYAIPTTELVNATTAITNNYKDVFCLV